MEGHGFVFVSRWTVGILLIFVVNSVNSCPDVDGATMDCDIVPVGEMSCTYVKGNPRDPPITGTNIPGEVESLSVSTAYVSTGITCSTRLNVTWRAKSDYSIHMLRGFFLTMSFLYIDKNSTSRLIFLNRTFDVSATNWTTSLPTLFRHECIIPQMKTLYHIELYSLPLNEKMYHKKYDLRTANTPYTQNQCERTGDPNYTSNWTATMWVSENPLEATIQVCFYTAPPSFNFSTYLVSLLRTEDNPLNLYTEQKKPTVDLYRTDPVCETFVNVYPGIYQIWVMPSDNPIGTCHKGAERDSCTATVVESINMTASTYIGTASTTPPKTVATTASKVPTTTPEVETTTSPTISTDYLPVAGLSSNKVAGIASGVVLGIIAAVVLAVGVIFCRRRSRPEKRRAFPNGGEIQPGPSYSIDDKQTVLLVYSCDNESHRKVVRNFAAFLHSCCKCDVRFDDWSQVDISQTNALDWLTKQLHQVRHIIFINSLGAFMQHKAWIEGATCLPVKEQLLLPDMFVPALRQIQARVYNEPKTKRLQYYHVYFPYTEAKHLLDVSFGQRYKLMKHVEDLFLNIHGMTKYSETGLTSACQINAHGYMGSAEGQALQLAIEEACASHKKNPNWFLEYYNCTGVCSTPVTLIDYRPASSNAPGTVAYQHLTSETSIESNSSRPASYDSADSNGTTKSSDEGVNFDPEIIPPSSSGSFTSDMDQRSVSIDVGFGDAMESSSTFDPNSPSVHLGFCPPVPDEDDEETMSIGSRMFFDKLNELNEQYDSGIPFSSFELKPPNRSSC